MTAKKLTQQAFDRFIDAVIQSNQVMGVQVKGETFDYAPLTCAADLRLDYDVTLQSPKQYVLPQCETLMTYQIGGAYQSVHEHEPLVLVGVHPYDVVAINQMDKLFSQDNPDSHYLQRRQSVTIIACDVVNPSKNVFASSMGTAVVKEGYDILLTQVADGIVAEAATAKGKDLLALATDASDASAGDLKARETVWAKNTKNLSGHQPQV